nr:mucin-1-like [Procambarus clarkii]
MFVWWKLVRELRARGVQAILLGEVGLPPKAVKEAEGSGLKSEQQPGAVIGWRHKVREIQERTDNESSTQEGHPAPLSIKSSGTIVLVPDPSNPLSDDAPAPGPVSDITVNVTEPTAAVTPAPVTASTQKPTTSYPPSPATSPPTVHTSTEPSTPAISPAVATKPSGALLPRPTSASMYSSDSADEDVSVGTPSPPSRKYYFSAADFLHDTTPTASNDSTTMSTRSRTAKKDKQKTKTKDQNLLQPSRKK